MGDATIALKSQLCIHKGRLWGDDWDCEIDDDDEEKVRHLEDARAWLYYSRGIHNMWSEKFLKRQKSFVSKIQ